MENLVAFILASILLELTPGPNMAFLALVSATEGRRNGLATVAGITVGLLIIGIFSALGGGAIISSSELLFQILRWAGIVYLLYLAWEGWQDSKGTSPHLFNLPKSGVSYFRHGLMVNLLNPKAALFFVTVLPTFLKTSMYDRYEAMSLTVIYVSIATIVHLLLVGFSGYFNPFLSDPKRIRITRRAFSLALVLVAIWVARTT